MLLQAQSVWEKGVSVHAREGTRSGVHVECSVTLVTLVTFDRTSGASQKDVPLIPGRDGGAIKGHDGHGLERRQCTMKAV